MHHKCLQNFGFRKLGALLCAPLLLVCMCISTAQAQTSIPEDNQSAIVFTYFHIGDDLMPSANLRKEQFEAQLAEIKEQNYKVLSLDDLAKALKEGQSLPDPAIALTFDGAHKGTLDYAAPLLLKAGLPFTVFVATDTLDAPSGDNLGWDDIRKLAKHSLVTIGLLPAAYQTLASKDPAEISRQINKAVARYRQELSGEPRFFAYPYGESSTTYKEIVQQQGFVAAFGQQSGVSYAGADMFLLPRFSLTESYGDLERFRLTARALPLPVTDISPKDPYVKDANPQIGFTVSDKLIQDIKTLSCFSSTSEKARIQIISKNRVEIRLEKPFEDERGRVNCTMAGPMDESGEQQRWRWFGMMLSIPVSYDDYEPAANGSSDEDSNLANQLQTTIDVQPE